MFLSLSKNHPLFSKINVRASYCINKSLVVTGYCDQLRNMLRALSSEIRVRVSENMLWGHELMENMLWEARIYTVVRFTVGTEGEVRARRKEL